MKEKVRKYIERYNMIRQGDVVAAGVSGGADSVCLLLLLEELSREIGFSLTVIHVEHGIRGGESLRDAEFTESLCRDLDVPFELCRVDVPGFREETGMSAEEAARELRYGCFLESCERMGADRIALAHHAEDCAETILFNLARGTGIRGMSGIRPVAERPLGGEAGSLTVIRPLLCVTRAEIEEWLAGRSTDYCTDSTNSDAAYSRNRIRERVLPELGEINPRAALHMLDTAERMSQICDYLDEAALEAGRGVYSVGGSRFADPETAGSRKAPACAGGAEVVVSCERFAAVHPVLQSHLMLMLAGMAAGSKKDITSFHVERLLSLTESGTGTKLSLPHGVTAEKTYDAVVLRPAMTEPGGSGGRTLWETELNIPGETAAANGLVFSAEVLPATDVSKKIPQKSYTKWFDYDKMDSTVCLRNRRPGDYIGIDAEGGRKKLKKFFTDEKVPASDRDNVCLLADGDHIIWVVGYRIGEAYKVTGQTRNILCVSVRIAEGEDIDG